jgi:MOSC domain-containing protein YiiM
MEFVMHRKIEKIMAYSGKEEAGRELAEARLIENMGLEGDCHAKGGERQISLILAETLRQLNDFPSKGQNVNGHSVRGLCSSRFRANISISGIAPASGSRDGMSAGQCLEAGEAVLEIAGETKRCYNECPLYKEGKTCVLAGKNLFARVLKSGVIRPGDDVRIRERQI